MLDLKSELDPAPSLAPAARTTTADGASVDLANCDGAVVVISAGTATGTNPAFTFEVQEADDNGSGSPGEFTAVAAAHLDGEEPVIGTANDDTVHVIGYHGGKRWLRATIEAVGGTSTPTLPCAAAIIRGKRRYTG